MTKEEEADYCYECMGYGNDYYIGENDEWVSACPTCPFNICNREDEA